MWDAQDEKWMRYALSLARSSLGKTAPNPSVGCVIASGAVLVAQGATGPAGRPHAEELALAHLQQKCRRGFAPENAQTHRSLAQAFADRQDGRDRHRPLSLYVTLEPCSRRSDADQLSCAERIAASPVARVLVACLDPFFGPTHDISAQSKRKSIALLETSGKPVTIGLCDAEARALNAGFFHRLATGRPILFELNPGADPSPDQFDAEFTLELGESVDNALERLGKAGLTRVFVRANSPASDAARRAGYLASL